MSPQNDDKSPQNLMKQRLETIARSAEGGTLWHKILVHFKYISVVFLAVHQRVSRIRQTIKKVSN